MILSANSTISLYIEQWNTHNHAKHSVGSNYFGKLVQSLNWVQKGWHHKKLFFFFFFFFRFGYHVSVEHDKNHPQPKFGGNRFMGTWDMATWGHIWESSYGPHEPIHVKFGVWGFSWCSTEIWLWKRWNAKKENLMTSHFSTLYPLN